MLLLVTVEERGARKVVVLGVGRSETLSVEVVFVGGTVEGVMVRAVSFQNTSRKPVPS
jgi:hypothetical protein